MKKLVVVMMGCLLIVANSVYAEGDTPSAEGNRGRCGGGECKGQRRDGPGRGRGNREGRGRPSREEILAKYDTDGDGEISEDEREAMRAAREAEREERVQERLVKFFEHFDKNGDETISKDEVLQAWKERREQMRERSGERREREGGRGNGRDRPRGDDNP